MPRTARRSAFAAVLLAAACAPDRGLAPLPAPPNGAAAAAFRLRIDTRSGDVTVETPGAGPSFARAAATGGGPARALLGADAVELTATNCAFSPIPGTTRRKRCTLQLGLRNRLSGTDLVRSGTGLPRLPDTPAFAGVVFPYQVAGLSDVGGTATPNADWDNAPVNFFNDFTGCTSARGTDCYRSETFPATLYGGASTGMRQVGFDVDTDIQNVVVAIGVAADLRDNPVQEVTVQSDADEDNGSIADPAAGTANVIGVNCCGPFAGIYLGQNTLSGPIIPPVVGLTRGYVRFRIADKIPAGNDVVAASLRMAQVTINAADPYPVMGNVLVESVDLGSPAVERASYDRPARSAAAVLSTSNGSGPRAGEVGALVQADVAARRVTSDFRLRFANAVPYTTGAPLSTAFAERSGIASGTQPVPALVIPYRLR